MINHKWCEKKAYQSLVNKAADFQRIDLRFADLTLYLVCNNVSDSNISGEHLGLVTTVLCTSKI